ncbi:hypothetical protein CK203_054315 [Vitis vinifera]|uniref:C-JID domain-containing protein n=1 Tax=Vitis vinifera TaxID=29760 RepID=A0A438H0T3_VITVI|nr:hypothetical protein CK203_054315 [Vitis vinifera]
MEEYPSFAGIPFSIVVPGSGIPDWFRHRMEGHDINIEVHQNWYSSTPGSNNNFLGLALSAVVAPQDGFLGRGWYPYCDLYTQNDPKSESSHICSFTDGRTYQLEHTPLESDHLWLAYVPSFFSFSCEKWSCIKFSFGTSGECVVKSCGVCPVYIKDTTNDHNKPMGSAYTDMNDSVLQATRIRSVGNSRTDSHAPDPERLERQRNPSVSRTRIDRNIQVSIPSGSARKFESYRNLVIRLNAEESFLKITTNQYGKTPSGEAFIRGNTEEVDILILTNSHSWYQERLEMQPNPFTSNNGFP